MFKGFVAGAAVVVAAGLLGAFLAVTRGWLPANADAKPPRWERWAAHRSLNATIAREAPTTPNPVPLDDANLIAGVKLYAADCAVCHGAADGAPSPIAKGLYQHPPQFARHKVSDDPEGETYWKIDHGIRMTGMPSYVNTLSETQMWQITLFLKNLDQLSPAAQKAWKAVPSQAGAPDESSKRS